MEKEVVDAIKELSKKIDLLIIIELAKSGLTKDEIADVIGISGKTIERMLPFGKLKRSLTN